ncbi:MAG: VOC family protein [Proteobacteria bacterium]|nr:VOC family protein [Pseudomonadota bacterium]
MQLGFLEFEVSDTEAWTAFLTGILAVDDVGGGRFRHDDHTWRIQITEGPADDLACLGWEFDDEASLDAAVARIRAAGHEVTEADASARDCAKRFTLTDPGGVPTELVSGMARSDAPFTSEVAKRGFVANELGLGHIVLTSPDKEASRVFYEDVVGFKLSDHIRTEIYGHKVDLSFFHSNARHHSLAFGGPQRKRLHHFMLEVKHFDDVGMAYDRAIRGGVRIMQTLGRHPNDRMFSFYALTPSRFHFEFGWGGREVDDETWEPTTYDCISEWGHHPPQIVFAKPKP